MTASAAHRRFLALFEAKGSPFHHEVSCKMRPGGLAPDRCLVSLGRSAIGSSPASFAAEIGRLLDALAAPHESQAWVARHEVGAGVVHFGFEDGEAPVHKVYLEYVKAARAALAEPGDRREPVVVHRALKWRVGSHDVHETLYRILPSQGRSLDERLAATEGADASTVSMARDLLRRALTRAHEHDLVLLDVADVGTARHSFDLQIYDARLSVADVAPLIRQRGRDLAIASDAIEDFVQRTGSSVLGHVAGGQDASGSAFTTLYFGARAR